MSALPNRPSTDGLSEGDGPSDNTVLSQNKILTLTFNQDCTALAMGTTKTYSLFTINSDNNIDETHDCAYEEVRIIERLFSSSLIAVVSDTRPHKLRVCHFRKGMEIHSRVFPTIILTVKLNRSRLVVCLENSIWIYDIGNMKVIHVIDDLPSNPCGLCALSSNDSNSDLAYPGSATTGEIQMFDTINLKPGILISAHNGPLAAIAFDMSGTRIATASNKGTVIRVHNAIDGARLFEFRRGALRAADIYSLAFSPDSMFLAASSNTGTIHIFRLLNPTETPSDEQVTWMDLIGRVGSGVASYLPKYAEVFTQDRAFATVYLQSSGLKRAIAMNILNKKLILFVAGYDGVVCAYEVNTTDGGECKQISQYLLFNMAQNSNNQQNITTNNGRNIVDETAGVSPPNLFSNDSNNVPLSSSQTNEKPSK